MYTCWLKMTGCLNGTLESTKFRDNASQLFQHVTMFLCFMVYLEPRVKAQRGDGQASAGGRPVRVAALALPILPCAAIAAVILRGRRLLLRGSALISCLWLLSTLLLMLTCSMTCSYLLEAYGSA